MWDSQMTLYTCIPYIRWNLPAILICVHWKSLPIMLSGDTKQPIRKGKGLASQTPPHLWAISGHISGQAMCCQSPLSQACPSHPWWRAPVRILPNEAFNQPAQLEQWLEPRTPAIPSQTALLRALFTKDWCTGHSHIPMCTYHSHTPGPGDFWAVVGLTHLHSPPRHHSTVHSKSLLRLHII